MDSLLNNQKSMATDHLISVCIRALLITICIVFICIILGGTILNKSNAPADSGVLTEYRQKDNSIFGYLAIPAILIAIPFFIRDFIEAINIHKVFKGITKNDSENIKTTFDSIRLLTTKRGRYSRNLRGFVLTDIQGNKYYYMLTNKLHLTFRNQLSITETLEADILYRDMEVPCYSGTNVIRELQLTM
ncbi:MAG: hypothetical protein E7388_04340 [Ruminococcaceae bacterium]|nr:hypothetical protein [Oscillospiraceae bacterium]